MCRHHKYLRMVPQYYKVAGNYLSKKYYRLMNNPNRLSQLDWR